MKIKDLKDGQEFTLRPASVSYRLNTIKKSVAIFTSVKSGRTFSRSVKTVCYLPCKKG